MVDTGFGFVEIAWVYPLDDGSSAAEWLSPEWGTRQQGLTEVEAEYGYRVEAFSSELDHTPAVRYDYREFIAKRIIHEFYRPFSEISRELGCVSRVQCHGAPVDLIHAYSTCDIPEFEALLFDPQFSGIAVRGVSSR